MIYIESSSHDPYYNLALEEYMFNEFEDDCFMLWQNDNTIVVGKFQNTIEEINLPYVEEKNINVVRRMTGGGAVYHDLGNLNFTFITGRKDENTFNFSYFIQYIVEALKLYGVEASFSSRNDITVDGRKISGNSEYIRGDRILHHGTILFDSDLSVVSGALNTSRLKFESKSVKSVKSRVANLKSFFREDVSLEDFKDVLKKTVFGSEDVEEAILSENDELKVKELRDSKYATWEWNYGKSPKSAVVKKARGDGGIVEVFLEIENGCIKSAEFKGDFFAEEGLEEAAKGLRGCKFTPHDVRAGVAETAELIHGVEADWLAELILS